jgi:DNA modification methylase
MKAMNDLFSLKQETSPTGSVECLGMTFPNDAARRQYFLEKLREKLQDPEFRKIEGFPIGSDEDILAMSDPPYYTACPNPFIREFIKHYGKPYDPTTDNYRREPLAVDVSEGKTDPLYNVHGYHTKVPFLAIVRPILHYTAPGDLVIDAFCGSGMTGIAAQWCGLALESQQMGIENSWNSNQDSSHKWGARRVILYDLCPGATFISANYNIQLNLNLFLDEANKILAEVENKFNWMFETKHLDGLSKGKINYTVWSQVFSCPECANEIVFLREALDLSSSQIRDHFKCPHCNVELNRKILDSLMQSQLDPVLGQLVSIPKRVPVLINYTHGKKTFEKEPDKDDLNIIAQAIKLQWPQSFPHDRMMHASEETRCWGDKWRAGTASFTHVHHLYLPRIAIVLGELWQMASKLNDRRIANMVRFWLDSHLANLSIQNRYRPQVSFPYNPLSGVYYIASSISEANPFIAYRNKLKRIEKSFQKNPGISNMSIIGTGNCGDLPVPNDSIDYVFTDPPFGDNLAYAELNFLVEAFYRVFTNQKPEAIISNYQGKRLSDYQRLMERCFIEYQRVLKPGRWITVVFHNSRNSVWNAIQEGMLRAGFVVADVRTLDKQQGSFNQAVAARSVKQDLVISAYKPNGGLEERFKLTAGTEEFAWDFIRTHLKQLPVFVSKDDRAEAIAERQNYLLFDRMVAFHVQRGVTVPLSAAEFYLGLTQRFPERDGMYFLPEQAAEYDKKRLTVKEIMQLELFVIDESSAIQWLRQQLIAKPQTFQDLHPQFLREIGGWQKHEKPLELSELLADNFLRYDGQGEVHSQIHSYLSSNFKELRNLPKDDPALRAKAKDRWYVPDPNKATDLERLRDRRLMKEFQEYRESKQKKLKVFRLEAVRAGFKKAWQERDYSTIIEVARKIPETILQEDPKLLMWYDQALTRMGE